MANRGRNGIGGRQRRSDEAKSDLHAEGGRVEQGPRTRRCAKGSGHRARLMRFVRRPNERVAACDWMERLKMRPRLGRTGKSRGRRDGRQSALAD